MDSTDYKMEVRTTEYSSHLLHNHWLLNKQIPVTNTVDLNPPIQAHIGLNVSETPFPQVVANPFAVAKPTGPQTH